MSSNTIWSGGEADKVYKQDEFTSTVIDSFSVTSQSGGAMGCSWDGIDMYSCGWDTGVAKLYRHTVFTATIQTSISVLPTDIYPYGIQKISGGDTYWVGQEADQLYKNTGFTSTVADSVSVGSIDASPSGLFWDGTNTLWSGYADQKLYKQSGFTTTVSDSFSVSGEDTSPHDITWDDVLSQTLWVGNANSKLFKNTGFTSTVADSLSVVSIDNSVRGISQQFFTGPLAPKYASRVKETTTSTGTGTINLAGAATAYQTFVAGIGDGVECFYCIVDETSGDWEIGIGTVTDASPDTLSRDEVLESSNSNDFVNFSAGTKNVFCVAPARSYMEVGCKLKRSGTQTLSSSGTEYAVEFDSEIWDPFGMHDTVTNNTRVTAIIPGRYLVTAGIYFAVNATGLRNLTLRKNIGTILADVAVQAVAGGDWTNVNLATIVELNSEDYIELYARQDSGGSLTIGVAGGPEYACSMSVQRLAT